jgi:hypothetical protein
MTMLRLKTGITAVLLLFVGASLAWLAVQDVRHKAAVAAVSGVEPAAPSPETAPAASNRVVTAYYFHGNVRCVTCHKIETYTESTVKTNFPSELTSGSLRWAVVNTDEPANAHFVKDFSLTTKSVVLTDSQSGRLLRWKNLDRIWDLVGDEAGFRKYIADETRAYLETPAQ